MLRRISILAFLALTAVKGNSLVLAEPQWPALSGQMECADALRVAQTMFNSSSGRLYAPPTDTSEITSEWVLKPRSPSAPGEQGLQEDPGVFDVFPGLKVRTSTSAIYWQRFGQDHLRIAVVQWPADLLGDAYSQGNAYSLYVLPALMSKDEFLAEIDDPSVEPRARLMSRSWPAPLVFQIESSQKMWFIDVGDPKEALSQWQVYRANSAPHDPLCAIDFRPATAKDAVTLLPEPVASFARLVDETLGPGLDAGAPDREIERQRGLMQHVWANVALRPWAVYEADVYNSREEVDAGLKAWSQSGHSYRRAYRQIGEAYPTALRSLCAYYEETFSLSPDKAQPLAEYVLDIAFRAHYVFPSRDQFRYRNVNNNPWKRLTTH